MDPSPTDPNAPTPTGDPAPEAAATALADARFVRVVVAPDGASLAAGGVLARALRERAIPFQVRVRRDSAYSVRDDALTVRVGSAGPADLTLSEPEAAPVVAFEIAGALGTDADPRLALAGVAASGADPAASTLADAAGLERSPGIGIPVSDLADGLGHSTLLHAPFSEGADAANAALAELDLPAELDETAMRRVASLAAVETATAAGAEPRAAEAVARALNPLRLGDTAPFATVEGYADVLSAVAREEPGTGIALALGSDARTPAIAAWRTHARLAHAALRTAETARYAGVFVVRVDVPTDGETNGTAGDSDRPRVAGRLRTVARLARDFRSPEPTALVVCEGVAAAATIDGAVDAADALGAAAETDDADGTPSEADVRFETDRETFVTTAREALA